MNRTMETSPPRIAFLTLGMLMVAWLFNPVIDAFGQTTARRESAVIQVSRIGGVCTYDILDQANDELFMVGPGSPIIFLADGVSAHVTVGNAENSANEGDNGKPGLRGGETPAFNISDTTPGIRHARASFVTHAAPNQQQVPAGSRRTHHKILIVCNNAQGQPEEGESRGRQGGPNADTGSSVSDSGLQTGAPIFEYAVPLSWLKAGKKALSAEDMRRVGGPGMDVDDP